MYCCNVTASSFVFRCRDCRILNIISHSWVECVSGLNALVCVLYFRLPFFLRPTGRCILTTKCYSLLWGDTMTIFIYCTWFRCDAAAEPAAARSRPTTVTPRSATASASYSCSCRAASPCKVCFAANNELPPRRFLVSSAADQALWKVRPLVADETFWQLQLFYLITKMVIKQGLVYFGAGRKVRLCCVSRDRW